MEPINYARSRRRSGRAKAWAARSLTLIASLAVVSVLLLNGSRAAFTDATETATNNWTAGTVDLVDDAGGVAMFNTSNMVPGDTVTKCIAVTYSAGATRAAQVDVRLYSTSVSTTNAMSSHLTTQVEVGTGGGFSDCGAFTAGTTSYSAPLATWATAKTSFSNGVQGFEDAAPGNSRTYKFTITLDATAPESVQGGSASAIFKWEAQSNSTMS
jgi:hypothetical protein